MVGQYTSRVVAAAILAMAVVGCSAASTSGGAAPPLPAPTTAVAGRPSAPAGINDDFRPDPASVVAATGRPQLVEFFAFW